MKARSVLLLALSTASIITIVAVTSATAQLQTEPILSSSENSAHTLHKELEGMKSVVPTKASLGRVIAIWQKLPEPQKTAVKNDIVSMSCAGFLIIGDIEMFGKTRNSLTNQDEFLARTTEVCKECGGTGSLTVRCQACKGTGMCLTCKGKGSISAPLLGGTRVKETTASRTCSLCDGSGKCGECVDGEKKTRHIACRGWGRIVVKAKCLKTFESYRTQAAKTLQPAAAKPVP